jgi:hypothetical protein
MTGVAAAALIGAAAAYSASIPSTAYGSTLAAASNGTVTSASISATVTGGVGALSYLWSRVSGDSSISITTPTASGTTFSATVSNYNTPKTATFLVTVTDSLGRVVASNTTVVTLEWVDTR